MTVAPSVDTGAFAFGSVLDLARLHLGDASAETCDACNTINPLHARVCKCCAHRLPAFYASRRFEAGALLRRKPVRVVGRAWPAPSAVVPRCIRWLCDLARGPSAMWAGMAGREASK